MAVLEATHRLTDEGTLCGEATRWLSPCDAAVTCPVCRALLQLEAMRRRQMIRTSVVLIARLASA